MPKFHKVVLRNKLDSSLKDTVLYSLIYMLASIIIFILERNTHGVRDLEPDLLYLGML